MNSHRQPYLQQSGERFGFQQQNIYESISPVQESNEHSMSRHSMFSRQLAQSNYSPSGVHYAANTYHPSQAFMVHQNQQRQSFAVPQMLGSHYHMETHDVGSGLVARTIEYGAECKMCGQSSPMISHQHLGGYVGAPVIPHRIQPIQMTHIPSSPILQSTHFISQPIMQSQQFIQPLQTQFI